MGKKRKHYPTIDEVLDRPWCYYCEKDFDDQKILVSHQKAKHFKCEKCNRRLNTAGGLSVHMSQVHKESLQQVHNALPNRSGLDHEIFAMEGIPEDIMDQHKQRVVRDYYEKQAEHLAATGNPLPGSGQEHVRKKPRMEPIEEMKARAREFVAKKKAAANGIQGANGYNQPYQQQQPYQHGSQPFAQGQQFAPPYGGGSPSQAAGAFAAPGQNGAQGLPDRPSAIPQDPRVRAQKPPTVSSADVDDLIASAARESGNTPEVSTPADSKPQKADKKSKGKDAKAAKPSSLVYDDNHDVSPEEQFSKLPQYTFKISAKLPPTVQGEASLPNVAGTVDDQAMQDS